MSAQSTDAANSAPMITARNAGDALRQISSKSSQAIAQEDKVASDHGGGQDAVTAPFPAGDQ